MIHETLVQNREPLIDRGQLGVYLRSIGVDVNIEDWDGLNDYEMRELILAIQNVDIDEITKEGEAL